MLIGILGFLCNFAFLFFIPSIFVINLVVAKNPKLRRIFHQNTLPPVLCYIFLGLSLFSPLTIKFFVEVAGYINLISLTPTQVASITVNDHVFTKPGEISKILSSLSHARWSLPELHKDLELHTFEMEIDYLSGEKRYYDGSYRGNDINGRNLETISLGNGSTFAGIGVDTPRLVQVLKEFGAVDDP